MDDSEIRNCLAGFLFFGDDIDKKISTLSGGEKGRLSLLMLMLGKGNLLSAGRAYQPPRHGQP